MNEHLISIILPVHNQARFIDSVVEQYKTALKKLPVAREFLLVVNGSRDGSVEVCERLAQEDSTIKVIVDQKKGWGSAVQRGLEEARGDLICYTNSARTSAQDLLLFLVYAIANPETVLKANRKIRSSFRRRLGSLFYNLECRSLFDLSFWDINGTPKVFPRKFEKLLGLSRNDDLIDLEFNVVCKEENYPVLEIPTFSAKRHGGKSTTGYGSAVKMYWGAFQMWRARKKITPQKTCHENETLATASSPVA